jgi:hypothetical protein
MTNELKLDLLEVLVKHKVIPENFLRDEKVRSEYISLRKNGITGQRARQQLADKFFTSEKNIEYIIYGKNKFKKNS